MTGTNLKFVLRDAGTIGIDGSLDFSAKLKAGLEVDVFVANAYAGATGGLNFEFADLSNVKNSTEVNAEFTLFIEAAVLFWGNSLEWTFHQIQIYPVESQSQTQLYSLTKDDLDFIEPINRISTFSNDPNVFLANVQTYCEPKIVSLGGNKMMLLYIDDVTSRSAENRSALVYSVFDGSQWSSPLLVHDDATPDFTPEVYADNNGEVHIVWQNAKTVFDSDITLDEMAPEMEVYYASWNGNSFENVTSLTDNNLYESRHTIAFSGTDISVVWQENSGNDPFGLTGTNQICRKQFRNGSWDNTETIATGLNPINSIATTYVGTNNVVAYTAKTNTDNTSMDDLEVFYYDGTITRITNDTIPDCSVTFLENILYWISDNTVVSVIGGDDEVQITDVVQIADSVTNINAIKNVNGQKAIVWSQDDATDTKIYGVYCNESTSEFSVALPLSEGDGVIRGWDAMMMPDGRIQLSYCAAEMLEEPVEGKPYGQLNLIQKSADKFFDISIGQMVTYDGNVVPNGEIILSADVVNNGSENVEKVDVAILALDGGIVQTNTIDINLAAGDSKSLDIPFSLPSEITKTEYHLKITPHGAEDISPTDNLSSFVVGYADLAIQEIEEERTSNGRKLVITVINQGYEPADGIFKVIDGGISQEVFCSNSISQLTPGETVAFVYEIDESRIDSSVSEDPLLFSMQIESDNEESDYVNNSQVSYVYPDYSVNLMAGANGAVSGTGKYIYKTTATITAVPASGYIFAGWYENGTLLDGLSEEYSFAVLSNRELEARFIPNNLSITNANQELKGY